MIRNLLAALGCITLTVPVWAQEKEHQLDPVTVTATLNPTASSRTGRNLLTIRGKELATLPVHSVDDILRYLPGLEVQARGPMGAQSDFVLRGSTFQQVLVLIDGMRINDPNTGHFSSYIPVTPADIERIEILKGASSAIYGADAVGGVIHIITKTFSRQEQPAKSLQAMATGGAYGLFNASAAGFYSTGKSAWSLSGMTNNADGQPQRGTNGFLHNNTISASFSHRLGKHWDLAVRSSYDARKFAAQGFYTTFISDTANEKVNTWWNQLRVSYQEGKNRVVLQAAYKRVNDHYQYNSISPFNDNTSNLGQALAMYEHAFSARTSLTGGAQFQYKNIVSNDRGDHTLRQAAAFVTLSQQAGKGWLINPALRLDWDEERGFELVPQLNTSYRYGRFQFRASAGKTIRDADFTERYNNYNKARVASGRVGNPGLSAEHSFSYEAGADYFSARNLRISATVFQRFHSDLIDWVPTPYAQMPRKDNLAPGGMYALASNIADVTTSGAETDVQWTTAISTRQQLMLKTGLVWLYSSTSNGEPSFYISSHARFMINYTLQYTIGRFAASTNGLYKVRNAQQANGLLPVDKDYFVMNIKVSGEVLPKKLTAFVQADNVFDRSYADLLGTQMPGRWLMGGLQLSL